MLTDILKGFLIGICASAPIGPIAILVVQKTLSKGHKAGFVTGMGACLVDTVFAVIALFALAFAQNFMEVHKELILIAGGTVAAILGWTMTTADPFRKLKADSSSSPDFIGGRKFMIVGKVIIACFLSMLYYYFRNPLIDVLV